MSVWQSATLLLALGSLAPRLAAGAEPARTAVNRYVVAIEVDAPAATVARVRTTSIEVLERLGVTPVVTQEGAPSDRAALDPLAYAYIDLENPHMPRLVVVDGATQRELMRRTLLETSSLETAIEEATLVLYMVIESLLSASTAMADARPSAASSSAASSSATPSRVAPSTPGRTSRRTAPPAAKAESIVESESESEAELDAAPEPERRSNGAAFSVADHVTLDAGAFLRLTTLDSSHAVAGAGGAVEIRARGAGPRFGALVMAAEHLPAELTYGDASIRVRPFAARLLPTLSFPLGPVFSGVLGVGGGIDWFRADVQTAPAGATRASDSSSVDATVSGLVGARAHLLRHLLVNLNAGLDFDASPRAFVVRTGGERRALLELSRVRPSLMLGLAFSAHGTPGAPQGGAP